MHLHIGADYSDGTCSFSVWAPYNHQVTLLLTKENKQFKLDKAGNGYWTLSLAGIKPGTEYFYQLDGKDTKPDPASHYQPSGVFGPSAVVDHEAFEWGDEAWQGLALESSIFYELHVGTFTSEGTFRAALNRIDELSKFGINAVEVMPVCQFSGKRNWGYDGVFPFAVHNTYGKPNDLKELVNECHKHGVAFFIDLVYNHVGPEGNCLNDYGPYFPATRLGRWGPRINLDGVQSSEVRKYFLENTLHWLKHYHIDGIRLDAVLAMPDSSSKHFLQELSQAVKQYSKETRKKLYLLAELGGYNEPKILTPILNGGFGFDAQWLEDFHHSLFTLLTGEREGYYRNYGKIDHLIEALSHAFVYVGTDGGEYNFRSLTPEESYSWIPANKFVVFSQNHDQVGNRLFGDRLVSIAGFEAAKLAAGMVLLSPYIPLLFMGEEYGETAPFLFFTDYQDESLKEAVRVGRKKEFAEFNWKGEVPDPQSIETFERSRINWQLRYSDLGKKIADFYRALIAMRKNLALFHSEAERKIKKITIQNEKILFMHYDSEAGIVANFADKQVRYNFPFENGVFTKIFDSSDRAWNGPGSSLPNLAVKNDVHLVNGFNFAVFIKSNIGEKNE